MIPSDGRTQGVIVTIVLGVELDDHIIRYPWKRLSIDMDVDVLLGYTAQHRVRSRSK